MRHNALLMTKGLLSVPILCTFLAIFSFGCGSRSAKAQLYSQTAAKVFWGQEPLSTSAGSTDPSATGSTYGAIRMNGTTWITIMSNCNSSYTTPPPSSASDYDWDSVDSYHAKYPGADLLYTWYRTPKCTQPVAPQGITIGPNHIYSSGPCYYPLTGSAEDCYVTSFWHAFMRHVCPSWSSTSGPVSDCWIKNYELWNEFNTEQYWTQSAQNLAKMGTDAAAVIRSYCSNCLISAGSTSGGGAGYQEDPSFADPNGHLHYAYYDTAMGDLLDAWYADSTTMPDFVSWHPYPTHLGYSNANGHSVALDPAPFPETIYSGDGSGLDLNDTSGSNFHNGSAACPATTVNEYTSTNCGDAVVTQAGNLRTIANNHHMSGKPLWATEGGYGGEYDIQGTTTGMTGLTANNFLRSNYMARWLILLAANGVARAYPYAYDANDSNCFMPQDEPNYSPVCTGYGYTETLPANTQTPMGAAWLQVEHWLNGSSAPVCATSIDHGYHIYSCAVTRSSPPGYHATIYWVYDWAQSDASFVPTPPSGKHFTQYQWLDTPGTYVSYPAGTVRGISGEPVLFEGIN